MILLDSPVPSFDRYIEASTEYWSQIDRGRPRDRGWVVVDLMHNNAGVLLSGLLVGRCAAHCYGARLAAVVCDRFLAWPSPVNQVRRLASAFGVERFHRVEAGPAPKQAGWRSLWTRGKIAAECDSLIRPLEHLRGGRLRQAVLDITIAELDVGDLIYDNYLRKTTRASIETLDAALVEEIESAVFRMHQYRDIMNRPDHIACVVSDSCYVDFGGLLRASVASGKTGIAKVLPIPACIRKYRSFAQCYDFPWPREEDVAFVKQHLGAKLQTEAADFFPPRRQRADEVSYFQIAYGADMKRIGASTLRAQLGLTSDVPAIGIMVPMFDDAPHGIPELLYEDSGRWLEETLAICAGIRHVVWLVRNHPYSVTVGTTSEFDRIVGPYAARYPHIKICPSDFSTESLFPLLHASLSVASTACLELASAGIPGVMCGRSYYADLGFLVRPRSVTEYKAALESIDRLTALTPSQIDAAKQVAYIYFRCTFQPSSLVPQIKDPWDPNRTLEHVSRFWQEAVTILQSYRFDQDPMWRNFRRMEDLDRSLQLRFDEIEVLPMSLAGVLP